MKHLLQISLRALFMSLALLLSLPMLALEVEIDGMKFDLETIEKQATVMYNGSGEYSGEVVIPESVVYEGTVYSVTGIGNMVFDGCSGLTSVTIPNSVTSIGEHAFIGCSGLKSVTIPNSVTSIGGYAFCLCSGLTSVTIPNSVTSIGAWAFKGCSGLTSVTISNSVTSIREFTFSDCYALTSVTIPNSVTSIGDYAFSNCYALTSVTIGNSVTSIGQKAFWDCYSLTSVTIPNSVTSIGYQAFWDCYSLTSVTIPNSVESIGESAFRYCSGLTSIVVEEGNSVYDSRNNCNAIIETESNTLLQGCNTTIIPNSVTSIGDYAFSRCSGLTSVTIPNRVESIGDAAFSGCSGLTSIVVEDGNPVYDSRNNCNAIIETATNTLHSGCKTTIIPNSVTSIGYCAFYGCSGLTSVTIPNSVTSIGDWTFYGCSGLTSVTIPNSVTSIGDYAFYECSNLRDVYCYAENVPTAYSYVYNVFAYAFDNSSIANATLHVPDASIESYKASAPWSSFGKIVALTEYATGIDELKGENGTENSAVYDLSGRRVQKAQKGIFIQNGKVMIQ